MSEDDARVDQTTHFAQGSRRGEAARLPSSVPMALSERNGRRRIGRRASGDGGAALLESAIILPFLVLMVFGIVEIGFLLRTAAVVNTSTRSGARLVASQYGSANGNSTNQLTVVDNAALTVAKDLQSRGSTDTPVELWIYKADTNGFPMGQTDYSSCAQPCFVYQWQSGAFVRQGGGSWSNPTVCGATHDTVGVFVRLTHAPIGFTNFIGNVTVKERTVMRLEPPNPNSCPAGS
jgi:TadE-like protein